MGVRGRIQGAMRGGGRRYECMCEGVRGDMNMYLRVYVRGVYKLTLTTVPLDREVTRSPRSCSIPLRSPREPLPYC